MQFALFLIPTVLYGLMFFAQHFPKSEASQKGLSLGQMFKEVGILGALVVGFLLAMFFTGLLTSGLTWILGDSMSADRIATIATFASYGIGLAFIAGVAIITNFSMGSVLLFILFVAHALVGAVELGTDNWIQNITGNILTSQQGKLLFVFTSLTMFVLRFCADFIEKKIGLSPVGILLVCAILACIGLNLTSYITSFAGALLALSVYGVGKTFFWPTMLAVASDRFPRTGAIAISIMGGVGMMSAGLIGAPGLGYAKDRFAGEALQKADKDLFAEYKAEKASKFPPFTDFMPSVFPAAPGLDGKKLGEVQDKQKKYVDEKGDAKSAMAELSPAERTVLEASIAGDRKTLVADSFIPGAMAAIYLGLMVYFASIGGYKPVHIGEVNESGGH
jgi:hypothetical protein